MKKFSVLLLYCAICFDTSLTFAQQDATKHSKIERIQTAIKEVMDSAIARSTHTYPDGSQTISTKPLFTAAELNKVHRLGDTAIDVLASYASSGDALHQRLALRLLVEFNSAHGLAALAQFAEHSRVREYAVAEMCHFPLQKTRSILEKYASDPEADVRGAARNCLGSYVKQ